jgi:hypothetical protein
MPVSAQVGRVYGRGRINMLTFPFQLWRQLRRESCGSFVFCAFFALTFGKAAGTSTTYGIVDAVSDWMSEACKIISL